MARKGISVWLLSTLTSVALVHLIDAIHSVIFDSEIKLFKLYPFVTEELAALTPTAYFWISGLATFVLWGITCAIAFENPVEVFLNKILSNSKRQSAVEAQVVDEKGDLLDAMNEMVIMNNTLLGEVKDMTCNVRAEVNEIQPLKDSFDKLKSELNRLKKEIKKFRKNMKHPNRCPTCGESLLSEFRVCPYCGENLKLLPKTIMALEDYR